jgi:carbon-monoxide dehydrogenase medium subunit
MINPLPRFPEFEYIRLENIDQTVKFLNDHQADAYPFLGGTDILIGLRDRKRHPKYLVDLKHLDGFAELSFDPNIGLTIGAAVTLNQLIASKEVNQFYPVLSQAARHVGGYQIRNRATMVGNVCNASPCGDTIGPNLIYQGKAKVVGPDSTRSLPLGEFFLGPGKIALKAGEIVQSITLPIPPELSQGTYLCIGRNKLADLAIAGVTILAFPDQSATSGYRFRIALSAVAPTVIIVSDAQNLLSEQKINSKILEKAALIAMENCQPIDDIRASKSYRREMIYILTLRGLQQVWEAVRS